jgi:hypothetical protein
MEMSMTASFCSSSSGRDPFLPVDQTFLETPIQTTSSATQIPTAAAALQKAASAAAAYPGIPSQYRRVTSRMDSSETPLRTRRRPAMAERQSRL